MNNKQSNVISVGPDGTIKSLYLDTMPLKSLGRQQVDRATDIVHNNDTQCFDVYLLPDRHITVSAVGFAEYEHARTYEVTLLNICRLAQVEPSSKQGDICAFVARTHTDALLTDSIQYVRGAIIANLNRIRGDLSWKNLLGLEA